MQNRIINIYTDGSYMKKKNIITDYDIYCGFGVYYPNKELPNISQKFTYGNKTSQRAELYAIYIGLTEIIKNNILFDIINIYTDSEYSIKALTVWISTWSNNGWKTSKKQEVLNKDIIIPIYNILLQYPNKINFTHIKAHTNNSDAHSYNNSIADELAKNGALNKN